MNPFPSIHAGLLVRAELTRQRRTVTWLASQLAMQRPNCYRILHSPSMHTDLLWRISVILEHDFFADFSQACQEQIH